MVVRKCILTEYSPLPHCILTYSTHLYPTVYSYTVLTSTPLYTHIQYSPLPHCILTYSTHLYPTVYSHTVLTSTPLYTHIQYSPPPHCILTYSTHLHPTVYSYTVLTSTPLYTHIQYSPLPHCILIYSTHLHPTVYSYTVLTSTPLYTHIQYSPLPHCILIYSTHLYPTVYSHTVLTSTPLYTRSPTLITPSQEPSLLPCMEQKQLDTDPGPEGRTSAPSKALMTVLLPLLVFPKNTTFIRPRLAIFKISSSLLVSFSSSPCCALPTSLAIWMSFSVVRINLSTSSQMCFFAESKSVLHFTTIFRYDGLAEQDCRRFIGKYGTRAL